MRPEKKEAVARFHREQILAAAETLFMEKGVAGATMDEIARKADYSKATIYVYFQNKDEIVSSMILKGMELLRERIGGAIKEGGDWVTAYYGVCEAAAGFYFERPMAFEAAAGSINVDLENPATPAVFRKIFEAGEALNRELEEFLRRGAEEGAIREQEAPLQTVMILWAAISGISRMAAQKEAYLEQSLSLGREAFVREGFTLLLNALRKGGREG